MEIAEKNFKCLLWSLLLKNIFFFIIKMKNPLDELNRRMEVAEEWIYKLDDIINRNDPIWRWERKRHSGGGTWTLAQGPVQKLYSVREAHLRVGTLGFLSDKVLKQEILTDGGYKSEQWLSMGKWGCHGKGLLKTLPLPWTVPSWKMFGLHGCVRLPKLTQRSVSFTLHILPQKKKNYILSPG